MILKITGGEVQIDEEDLGLVSTLKWHVGDTGYVVWRGTKNGKKQTIRMHRLITNCPRGKVIDHVNHNKLDNRKENLSICTQSDNMRNLRDQGKGYWYQKQNSNWVVEIYGNHVGVFATENEAKEVVELVRSGGTYVKPLKTHCNHGHSLDNAYIVNNKKTCRSCQSRRSREYYVRNKGRGKKSN